MDRDRVELGVNDSDHAPVLLHYLQIRVPKGAVRVRPAPRRIAATRRIARRVDVHSTKRSLPKRGSFSKLAVERARQNTTRQHGRLLTCILPQRLATPC